MGDQRQHEEELDLARLLLRVASEAFDPDLPPVRRYIRRRARTLQRLGVVLIVRSERGPRVRLSEQGYDAIRALCGMAPYFTREPDETKRGDDDDT